MSKSQNAIAEIKRLMKQFGFMSDEATLKSFKLEDNTILQTADLKAGENIIKINEQFEQVGLEDGSYRLVENFEIEVKDGKIENVKEIFVDAKLEDGTQIKVEGDSIVPGAKVVVVTADAEVPAPDGQHTLDDGSVVETKDGVVVAYEVADEDGEEVPADPTAEDNQPEPPMIDKPEGPGKEVPVELMDMLKDFIVKCSEKLASMEEKMGAMNTELEAFKKSPAAKPIANGKTEKFSSANADELEDKINKIMSLRKTINN